MRQTLVSTALLALLAGCMGTGQTGGGANTGAPLNTPTVAEFAEFLKSQGHRAQIKPDGTGDPMLRVNQDGDNFTVFFLDCNTGGGLAARRCTGAEYTVSYPVEKTPTLARINELNETYRMAKAYITSDGDPAISMAMNIGGAFGSKNLADNLEWWTAVMRQFEKDIGWD